MKTLIFSSHVVLDGAPSGFSAAFKMLDTETGRLYVYRTHIARHIYVGTQIPGMGSKDEDLLWWERMFYALAKFIEEYYSTHGYIPSDQNIYQDRRPYTSDRKPFGEKIYFLVEKGNRRSLNEKELVLNDTAITQSSDNTDK